jgi:hypothetical protein
MGNCQNRHLSSMKKSVLTRRRKSIEYDYDYDEEEIEADNDVMKFLIVLAENDFKANCWPFKRYSTSVKNGGAYLSGELDVISIRDISQRKDGKHSKNLLKYKINEITNLKTLYIKLPKENMYVKSNVWQFEYMKSQIREIIHIFGLLGAKSVEYKVLSSNLSSFEFSSNVSAGNIPIESGATINNKNGLSTEISGNITYQVPDKFPTSCILCSSDNIYYLTRKDDWKDICERRITNKATSDNFTYKFNTDISFSFKVTEKFKKLGISFNVSSDETKNFTMEFKVNYYTDEDIFENKNNWDLRSIKSIHSDDNLCFKHQHYEYGDNSDDSEFSRYHSDDEYDETKDGTGVTHNKNKIIKLSHRINTPKKSKSISLSPSEIKFQLMEDELNNNEISLVKKNIPKIDETTSEIDEITNTSEIDEITNTSEIDEITNTSEIEEI